MRSARRGHLLGGAAAEGEQQDAVRIGTADDEVGDAVGERVGYSGCRVSTVRRAKAMPPTSDVHLISGSDLQRFASALFQACGVAGPMADEWAKSLVWANLRGVDSHGVLRIPTYISAPEE